MYILNVPQTNTISRKATPVLSPDAMGVYILIPQTDKYFLMNSDISIPRNKTLAKLFRLVKLAENAGFGFDRMNTGWSSYSKVLLEYTTERDFVIVKFFLEPETVYPGVY